MKLGNLNSLHFALIGLVVLVIMLMGVSNVRQARAEKRLLSLVSAIKSANSLEELQSFADGVLVSSGASRSAKAGRVAKSGEAYGTCLPGDVEMIAEHGEDTGLHYCTESGNNWWDNFMSDFWSGFHS